MMVKNGKKIVVKKLSVLIRGIASNHVGDFYCLNCFHSYSMENKLKKHEKVCNDHDYCYVEMPNENNEILKQNYEEKLLTGAFIIYGELEFLLKIMHLCQNNFEKSYTEKKLSIRLLVIQYLQVFRLTQQKTKLIVTEVKIIWKAFVKT